jgi:DNA-binding MarR family transcriptional regulator
MASKEKELFVQIQTIGSRFVSLEKGLVFQHGDTKLFASEIHLIKTVDYNPDVSASGIAKLLGVTKGAISQTISRLEKKGIITRECDPSNSNIRKISLTPFGKDALAAFHTQKRGRWEHFARYYDSLPEEEHQAIIRFLHRLNNFLKSLG